MKLILMTGAAGGVARRLGPLMRKDYRLRLSDVTPAPDWAAGAEWLHADLADFAAVRRAVDGVDGIVHLGGFSVEGPWPAILEANIVGTYHVFEAARSAGVRRIVYASSNHAVGFYRRDQTIGVDVAPRPDSRYGVSKVFGEALASLYAFKYGAEVLSIRLGNADETPRDVRRLSIWISMRDLYQLVRIGLERPGIRHEIVYGMSDNGRAWWDNANARRLGYAPQDRADDFAAAVLAAYPAASGDAVADAHQGGPFCTAESGGGLAKAGSR